jgi:hypothetical protein
MPPSSDNPLELAGVQFLAQLPPLWQRPIGRTNLHLQALAEQMILSWRVQGCPAVSPYARSLTPNPYELGKLRMPYALRVRCGI